METVEEGGILSRRDWGEKGTEHGTVVGVLGMVKDVEDGVHIENILA